MKKLKLFILTTFFIVLSFSSVNVFANGLSQAIMTNTSYGIYPVHMTDPYTNAGRDVFAGLVVGTVDGSATLFYCSDISRTLSFPDYCHSDSSIVSPQATYIVNNYYPTKNSPVGMLDTLNQEVAATQVALWTYSDGVDINSVTPLYIRNRAMQIIADANLNGAVTTVFTTMVIIPSLSDPNSFYVKTTDENGVAIAVNNIQLAISGAGSSLSTYTVSTSAGGISPDVETINGSGQISATAMVIIPQGVTYTCPNSQRMVLALPTVGKREATYSWGALPVQLSSFNSVTEKNKATLYWATTSEINNFGFNIERLTVNNEWIKIGNVTGNGTTSNTHSYQFSDCNLLPGNYYYRLKQIDYNGNFEYHLLSNEVVIGLPEKYELSQNYPNPFNPTTTVAYSLPEDGAVSLKLYDIAGKEVMSLINNEQKSAGSYTVNIQAASLTSGMYFYTLHSGNFTETKKMTLIK